MLHLLHDPREIIAERVVFTHTDQSQIARCRGPLNRLGSAYQTGLTGLARSVPCVQSPWYSQVPKSRWA
jgi:hypothetical protein